ncbi:hypothetical protein ACWDYJ_23815 [Streptomyces sp. NPDC003042]
MDAVRSEPPLGASPLELRAVITDGVTYAGIRNAFQGSVQWHNLTDPMAHPNYPSTACGVAISTSGTAVTVEVSTTDGQVWQTWCNMDTTNPTIPELDCVNDPDDETDNFAGPWTHLEPDPTPAAPPLSRSAHSERPAKP